MIRRRRFGDSIWPLVLLLAGLFIVSACAFLRGYSLPPAYIPKSPVAADFPDAGVAVLEDVGVLDFRITTFNDRSDSRLIAVLDHRRRMKILRPEGLNAADVALPMDGFSTITRVVARSVSPTGAESSLASAATQITQRDNPDERASDVKLLKFHIPDAEVGGLLEYRYERVYTDPLLIDPWVFGDVMPVLRSEFRLAATPEAEMDYVYGRGERLIDQPPARGASDTGQEQAIFEERDLPGLFHEPFMPHITRLTPWIAVTLRAVRSGGSTARLDTWNAMAARVWDDMTQIKIKPNPGTLIERYDLVRQTLHPLLLPGLGIHPPVPGDALVAGAPACSRDATSVLLQSLVGSDIEAYPALITGPSGPPLAEHTPAYYPFIRAVAAVRIDDRMLSNQVCTGDHLKRSTLCGLKPRSFLYLDPLCKQCQFGVLPLDLVGGRALILQPDHPQWVQMTLDPPERHSAVLNLEWSMDARGIMRGSMIGELRGTQAQRLRERVIATSESNGNADDRAQAIAAAIAIAIDRDPGALKLTGGKLIDQDHPDLSLGINAHVQSRAEPRDSTHFLVRSQDLVGSTIPTAWRPIRRLSAVTDGPMWMETTADVTLPPGFGAQVPAPVKIVSALAEYAAEFKFQNGHLYYARRYVLKAHAISEDEWTKFGEFLQQVRDAEHSGAVVWENDI